MAISGGYYRDNTQEQSIGFRDYARNIKFSATIRDYFISLDSISSVYTYMFKWRFAESV